MEFIPREQRGYQRGEQSGLLRGRTEGVSTLTLKLLENRLGAVPETLTQRLAALSLEQLEQLSLAASGLASVNDLSAWLEQHASDNTTAH